MGSIHAERHIICFDWFTTMCKLFIDMIGSFDLGLLYLLPQYLVLAIVLIGIENVSATPAKRN